MTDSNSAKGEAAVRAPLPPAPAGKRPVMRRLPVGKRGPFLPDHHGHARHALKPDVHRHSHHRPSSEE